MIMSADAPALPASDPQSASRLFSSIVGDARSTLKCAGRVARFLEEQFIIDGWPAGRNYGCEIDLARRYGVSPAIVRETARILEARGTARMRPGKHGGLVLTSPPPERLYDMIRNYAYLIGVTRNHVRTARLVLDRVAAYLATERGAHLEFIPLLDRSLMNLPTVGKNWRRLLTAASGNAVVTVFSDCLDQLREMQLPENESDPPEPEVDDSTFAKCVDRLVIASSRGDAHAAAAWAGACSMRIDAHSFDEHASHADPRALVGNVGTSAYSREALHRTRAGQIVNHLMKRVGHGQWTEGRLLGNQLELCERYRVDRGVLRQAIRILEAAEIAASVPGRGHGLVARSPGPGSVSRLLCCLFAAHRVGYHQSFQVFKWLSVEMAALAARNAKPADLVAIRAAHEALAMKRDTVHMSELMAVEEQQFALAANPILDLCFRSAKAFPSWVIHSNMPVTTQVLHDFLEGSAEVTAALAANKPAAAAAAQEAKFARLKSNLDEFFEHFRSGSLALSQAV